MTNPGASAPQNAFAVSTASSIAPSAGIGRTPSINNNGGRDHYSKAWSTVLFGGGIRGGQVVGASDSQGAAVTDRSISAVDLMATICRILGIDYSQEIVAPNGRPIRLVDKDEALIRELLI